MEWEQTSIRRILGCIRQHKGRRDLEDDGAVAVDDDHQEGMDGCGRRIDSVGTIIYDICTMGECTGADPKADAIVRVYSYPIGGNVQMTSA